MRKLNRKGYLTVEVIISSAIAFVIAYFLIELTVQLTNKTDNTYNDTVMMVDKGLLEKNIKSILEKDITNYGGIVKIEAPGRNHFKIIFYDGTNKEIEISRKEGKLYLYYGNEYSKKINDNLEYTLLVNGNESLQMDGISDGYLNFSLRAKSIYTDKDYGFDISVYNKIGYTPKILSTYIESLYNVSAKEMAGVYQYAPSEWLMRDRFGLTAESVDEGNVRYYGTNPNNYIYFNCNDYSNQSADSCEKWRIIGVFDGMARIIGENKGIYSIYGDSNDWKTSYVKYYFNEIYLNSSSGDYGIKNVSTRNKIADTTWNLGSIENLEQLSGVIYKSERELEKSETERNTSTDKIAIMYLSDYGYATDFNTCDSRTIEEYFTVRGCENWISSDYFNDEGQWFITPLSRSFLGITSSGMMPTNTEDSFYITPVLSLNGTEQIVKGDGSFDNPYQLLS